jgi:hypothetical protein
MFGESMNDRNDPFFASQRSIELLNKFMIVLKHLRNAQKLTLVGIDADIFLLFIDLDAK